MNFFNSGSGSGSNKTQGSGSGHGSNRSHGSGIDNTSDTYSTGSSDKNNMNFFNSGSGSGSNKTQGSGSGHGSNRSHGSGINNTSDTYSTGSSDKKYHKKTNYSMPTPQSPPQPPPTPALNALSSFVISGVQLVRDFMNRQDDTFSASNVDSHNKNVGLKDLVVNKKYASNIESKLQNELVSKWNEKCEVMNANGIPEENLEPFIQHMTTAYDGLNGEMAKNLDPKSWAEDWTDMVFEFKYNDESKQRSDDKGINYGMMAFKRDLTSKITDCTYVLFKMDFKLDDSVLSGHQRAPGNPNPSSYDNPPNYPNFQGNPNSPGYSNHQSLPNPQAYSNHQSLPNPQAYSNPTGQGSRTSTTVMSAEEKADREKKIRDEYEQQVKHFFRAKALQGFRKEGVIDKIKWIN